MTTHQELSDEDYEIYTVALTTKEVPTPELIVFKEETRSSTLALAKFEDEPPFNDPKKLISMTFPEIVSETLDNFIQANETPIVLRPRFRLGAAQQALSKAEHHFFFGRQTKDLSHDRWRAFDERYPNAKGIIFSFSRVGFNLARTQALVEIEFSRGFASGKRVLTFLAKSDEGLWMSKTDSIAWIS